MSPNVVAAVLGALAAVALVCVLAAALPAAPINLAAAVTALDEGVQPGTGPRGWWSTRLTRLAGYSGRSRNRWWGIPAADLDVLGHTAEHYLLRRARWAASSVLGAFAVAGLMWFADLPLPTPILVLAAVLAGAAGSLVPVLAVREDATRAREQFRRATAAYLDLVAQERATGRAPSQALAEAATVADGWVFARITGALGHAMHAGHTPWVALSRLGQRMSVIELADLADILATAADGAAIYSTLVAKAASLRTAALAADKTEANVRSQRLALPVALLLVAFLLLVMYPAMIRLLAGGAT